MQNDKNNDTYLVLNTVAIVVLFCILIVWDTVTIQQVGLILFGAMWCFFNQLAEEIRFHAKNKRP